MFHHDLISLLRQWKGAGDEIMLLGDFNENIYLVPIARSLSLEELRMGKTCQQTTGEMLPATHYQRRNPIDAVFCTAGLVCTAITLLPSRVGMGDHRFFILDLASETILGNVFPWVIPLACCLLNGASDKIRNNYSTVLNQLLNRHLMFKKMLCIDRTSNHLSPAIVQLCMNKVNMELEQFMKLVEMDSYKYKLNNIEWSPYSSGWIHQRWLLKRVQTHLSGKTCDPCNLFCECNTKGSCKNVQLYYWSKGLQSPQCKFCGVDEYTTHIARCRDSGQASMFQISVQEIYDWMAKTLGNICIAATIKLYLLSRGETLMESCIPGRNQSMLQVVKLSNRLGWDSFVEGWIITQWPPLVMPLLAYTSPCLPAKFWGCQFISRLHNLLHKQWVYRNLVIHYKGKDSLTLSDHHEILNCMEGYLLIDPETLLP
jgi:hypothetical protein